jgi:hypothetical protein
MKLFTIQELINSEGSILTLLTDENESLFIMALTENGKKKIITETNHFQLSLYWRYSRINLKELFLLNQDSHFFVVDGNKTEAVFFEITTDNLPNEISGLECGNELYHFIPSGMRNPNLEYNIKDLLPSPLSSKRPEVIDNTVLSLASIDFFNSEKSPLSIVSIESDITNPDEHDYLMCPTKFGKEEVMVKINPYVLFLFLHNRLSVSEVYRCRMNDFYIIHDGHNFYRSKYNSYIQSLLQNLGQLNRTYYSLDPSIRIDAPMLLYKHHIDFQTISGKGIFEPGFRKKYDIEIEIVGR